MAEVTLCPLDDLPPGAARRFDVGGHRIAVVRIGDDFYAIGDTCTHADVSLAEGEVDADERTHRVLEARQRRSPSRPASPALPATRRCPSTTSGSTTTRSWWCSMSDADGAHVLEIDGLRAGVAGKEILRGIDLTVRSGEVHAVMGPNGSGKSTLSHVLMGRPGYEVLGGSVTLDGVDLLGLRPGSGRRPGCSWPCSTRPRCRACRSQDLLDRGRSGPRAATADGRRPRSRPRPSGSASTSASSTGPLNVDLSGGEKKRNETLQLGVLRPAIAVLDELDSGLDVDALRACARRIEAATDGGSGLGVLAITHYSRLLHELRADQSTSWPRARSCAPAGPSWPTSSRTAATSASLGPELAGETTRASPSPSARPSTTPSAAPAAPLTVRAYRGTQVERWSGRAQSASAAQAGDPLAVRRAGPAPRGRRPARPGSSATQGAGPRRRVDGAGPPAGGAPPRPRRRPAAARRPRWKAAAPGERAVADAARQVGVRASSRPGRRPAAARSPASGRRRARPAPGRGGPSSPASAPA